MTSKRAHCPRCCRPQSTCLCQQIRLCSNRWPVTLLQHTAEACHPKGTAVIAQLALSKIITLPFTDSDSLDSAFLAAHNLDRAAFIYPSDHPQEPLANIATLQEEPPRPLLFIDATWRKSKALLLRSPGLQTLPRFGFSPDSAPRYRIRKASRPNFYSTLEAIAATLEGVESGSDYSPLLEAMDAVIESQLEFRRAGKSTSKTKREI